MTTLCIFNVKKGIPHHDIRRTAADTGPKYGSGKEWAIMICLDSDGVYARVNLCNQWHFAVRSTRHTKFACVCVVSCFSGMQVRKDPSPSMSSLCSQASLSFCRSCSAMSEVLSTHVATRKPTVGTFQLIS
jgi:hypothetical protein